jgi:hypothetical protein
MRKLFLFIAILLTIYSCKHKNWGNRFIETGQGVIPDQYIVIMKDSYEEPVINSRIPNSNRHNQQNANRPERVRKENKLKNYLISKGVNANKQKMKFVDI